MPNFIPSLEQDRAIAFRGNMVVIARPGSGKTSVMSRKVQNKLAEVRAYQGVIAISFTHKASDELERRCRANASDVKQSFFGTIDEFCLREIIRPFVRQLMPAASDLRTAKIAELPDPVKQLLPVTSLEVARDKHTPEFLPFLRAALVQGYIPLESVGMLAHYVFKRSVACKKYFAARYCAVFIDEYQDSGYFQHELFLLLWMSGMTAVAVGDVNQSIYSFAHKDSRYLLALTQPNSAFTCFSINTNFRSHPAINDFALRLLDLNHPLLPNNDPRVFIKSVDGDQRAIAAWLTTAIPHLMRHYQVEAAAGVAVLCRHQHSARLIAESIELDHHLSEDSPFVAAPSAEANLFADLLRLRYDPQLTAETLVDRASTSSRKSTMRRAIRQILLRCRTCSDADLATAVTSAATELLGRSLSAIGEAELRDVCADARLLAQFRSPSPGAVQIMTLHKAKGLEFDLVFHADLYQHVLPSRDYPPGSYGRVIFSDEKQCLNLHYVGITRAIKACVLLTSSLRLNKSGAVKPGANSEFIGRNGTSPTLIPW